MAKKPEEVVKSIVAGKFAPVYFLQGDEPYYIDHITKLLEQKVLTEAEKTLNLIVAYGKDTDMGKVLNNARRFPMFGDKSLVIIKEAQDLADLNRAEPAKLLESYLKNPQPSTVLVFAHKNKTLDGRKPLSKAMDQLAVLVECKRISDFRTQDLLTWISDYINEQGLKASPNTVRLIADSIGNDLSRIANEIDKLQINLKGADKEITADLVQKYIGISKEYNVFELQNALSARNAYKAHQIINYFESNPKENPLIPIVSNLFSYFWRLVLFHANAGKAESEQAKALKIAPFQLRDYKTASAAYTYAKAVQVVKLLQEADLKSKGVDRGDTSDADLLRELVFKIMYT